MFESLEAITQTAEKANPAVRRCCDVMERACRDVLRTAEEEDDDRGDVEYLARRAPREAYCKAMPPLAGADNICDFIACVAHGMLVGAISGSESTRLLYAAQIATSAHKGYASGLKALAA